MPLAAISLVAPRALQALPQAVGSAALPPDRIPQFPFPPNPFPCLHLNRLVPYDESRSALITQGQVRGVNQFAAQYLWVTARSIVPIKGWVFLFVNLATIFKVKYFETFISEIYQ